MVAKSLDLNFTITNPGATSKICYLFGANLVLPTPIAPFIVITPGFGVDYNQILLDSELNPFEVGELRMYSTNTAQVQSSITVLSQNIYGDILSKGLPIVSSLSEYQEFLEIARVSEPFYVSGLVSVSFNVLPFTTLICSMGIKKKVNRPIRFGEKPVSKYSINKAFSPLIIEQ